MPVSWDTASRRVSGGQWPGVHGPGAWLTKQAWPSPAASAASCAAPAGSPLLPLRTLLSPSPPDIHIPHATVHEALQISARLRLPSHIGRQADVTEAFVQEARSGAEGAGRREDERWAARCLLAVRDARAGTTRL